jgi:hypothetical protein
MSSLVSGARIAWTRSTNPASLVSLLAGLLIVAAAAELERRSSPVLAADRALGGAALGLVLPVSIYLLLEHVHAGGTAKDAFRALRQRGGDGRRAAVGAKLVSLAMGGVLGVLVALVAVALGRGWSDPMLVEDALRSSVVGMWGGLAYVSLFSAGSALSSRGWGRPACLIGDWLLGSSPSALAVPWPRAHLQNLLGFEPVLGMTQTQSLLTLLAACGAYVGFALWRTPA